MEHNFNSLEYAYDNYAETINYMSEQEIEQIKDCETEEDVEDYLRIFYERT